MIPLKLKLKNFLSYGTEVQTIDFAPYGLICFSGKNGHGKSALLDAITWAMWGQARKVSGATKADANLLHLGQTQMMVCLDFLCNGQTYRVKREYTKTYGKSKNNLEFGILNTKTDTIAPLTDKTIRATQAKIEQTLRLTFEAFSNSAFLRQGQANEFSKKSPKERKEIFAQILGLQQYELVRKRAMERCKEAGHKRAAISSFSEKITVELEKKQQLQKEIKAVTSSLQQCEKKEIALALEQKELETKKQACTQQEKQFELLQFQKKEIQKKQETLYKEIDQLTKQWKTIEKKQANLPDESTLKKEKEAISKTVAAFQKTQQKRITLQEQLLEQKKTIQAIETDLQQQQMKEVQQKKLVFQKLQLEQEAIKLKQEEIDQQLKTKQKSATTIEAELKTQTKALNETANIEKKVAELDQLLSKGKEQYQHLVAQGNLTKQKLRELHQKQMLAKQEDQPCCPLCEQNLSASRKRFLQAKFLQEHQELNKKLTHLTETIKKTKADLVDKHTTQVKNKKQQEERTHLRAQHQETEKKHNELQKEIAQQKKLLEKTSLQTKKTEKELVAAENVLQKQISDGPKLLQKDEHYKKAQAAFTKTEKKLHALSYDRQKHLGAVDKLQKLEKTYAECADLHKEIALQGERKKQIDQLKKQTSEQEKQNKLLQEKLKTYEPLHKTYEQLKKQQQELKEKQTALTKEKEILLQHKGAYENQQKKLQELEVLQKKEQKKLDELNEHIDDYQEIAAATSKNGIQALLIENAIPEVEHEANRLLSKLTNNQAQIFIESLRDLQKGGTKETLDIKISDPAGIRPYELFSGGEAFRIDFALRIAISKLLARRAGTALQTLIIDEGFGSQDQEGLAQIMDAIHKIQDDFVKIIVVSHLPSMKDQFPVHFFVQKDARGSRVDVMQLG